MSNPSAPREDPPTPGTDAQLPRFQVLSTTWAAFLVGIGTFTWEVLHTARWPALISSLFLVLLGMGLRRLARDVLSRG